MRFKLKISIYFLIFWLILGFFSINFFIFGSLNRLFVKNQLGWQLFFDNSYTQRLFLLRCNFVFKKLTYADPTWYFFPIFAIFYICTLVVIARNSLFVQHEGL